MKKLLFTFTLAFLFLSMGNIKAQSYNASAGAKLGTWLLGTYKKQIKESVYVDLYGGFYGSSTSVLLLGGALELHKPIEDVENLYWYYGAGGNVFLGSVTGIGINGVVGLDYAFEEIPLNLSIDWMPTFYFGNYSGFSGELGTLSVRYILGQD